MWIFNIYGQKQARHSHSDPIVGPGHCVGRCSAPWIIRFSLQAEAGAIGPTDATVNSSAVAKANCTTASVAPVVQGLQNISQGGGTKLKAAFSVMPTLQPRKEARIPSPKGPSPDCAGQVVRGALDLSSSRTVSADYPLSSKAIYLLIFPHTNAWIICPIPIAILRALWLQQSHKSSEKSWQGVVNREEAVWYSLTPLGKKEVLRHSMSFGQMLFHVVTHLEE